MPLDHTVKYEGKLYYSVHTVARLLGTTNGNVKKMMVPEGLEWMNFRVNGPIYISAESFNAYEERRKKQTAE